MKMKKTFEKKVSPDMNNEEFRRFEQKQIVRLKNNRSIVIRLDGKDVTKNKKKYDLSDLGNYRKHLLEAAGKTMTNYLQDTEKCFIYTVMDEISFVFPNARTFLRCFNDGNIVYCSSVFLQQFLRNLPDPLMFGINIFQYDDIWEYIAWRKRIGYQCGLIYLCKKYSKNYYLSEQRKELSTEEIIEKIRQDSKFYELVMGNQEFLSGKTVKYEGVYKEDKLLVKATGISVKQNI